MIRLRAAVNTFVRPLRLLLRSLLRSYRREVWLVSVAAGLASGAYLGMMQLLKTLYVLRLGYGTEFVVALRDGPHDGKKEIIREFKDAPFPFAFSLYFS